MAEAVEKDLDSEALRELHHVVDRKMAYVELACYVLFTLPIVVVMIYASHRFGFRDVESTSMFWMLFYIVVGVISVVAAKYLVRPVRGMIRNHYMRKLGGRSDT